MSTYVIRRLYRGTHWYACRVTYDEEIKTRGLYVPYVHYSPRPERAIGYPSARAALAMVAEIRAVHDSGYDDLISVYAYRRDADGAETLIETP